MAFEVPNKWESYHRQIKNTIDILIRQKVISGISPGELNTWWQGFSTDEERYLAAHLLDSMVFRSQEMLEASCHHLLNKTLPQILHPSLDNFNDQDSFVRFLKSKQEEVVFAPVTTGQPGKSGEALVRLFIRATGIPNSSFKYASDWNNFSEKTKVLVIMDDIVGTGTQFTNFLNGLSLQNCSLHIIYLPLFAHEKGIEKIRHSCPDITMVPIEILGEDHNFFRECKDLPGSGIWEKDESNSVEDVKEFYVDMLKKKGIWIRSPFGFGDLGLTVYTSMSTPNNSLHIFYTNKNPNGWQPFLKR